MLGLAFLFVFFVYLLISLGIITYAVRKAKKRGIAGWKWGLPAALVMYLIVFWDHIPTLIAHNYYCDKEAGFFVYKTLEEWKAENPGVAKTLTYKEISNSEKHGDDYILSGFSATLFESIDNPGEFTFAIRGTAGPVDLVIADGMDIVLDGIALESNQRGQCRLISRNTGIDMHLFDPGVLSC